MLKKICVANYRSHSVNVQSSAILIKHHAMKTYGSLDV